MITATTTLMVVLLQTIQTHEQLRNKQDQNLYHFSRWTTTILNDDGAGTGQIHY